MGKPLGSPKTGGGSRKGIPNKSTALVKDMVSQALEGVGGADYLKRQAEANPAAFMTLVGKLIPVQVGGDPDNPIKAEFTDHEASARLAAILAAIRSRVPE